MLDAALAFFVEIDVAENVRGHVALRIEALVFLHGVDALKIQRLHRIRFVRRQFARYPHEGRTGIEFRFENIARNIQNTGEQMRRERLVLAEFRRNREGGLDFRAHRQRTHVAVVNRAALGSNFDCALLLPVRAGQVVAVLNQLQKTQASKNRAHPERHEAGDDQQSKLNAILLHLCSRPDAVPAKLNFHPVSRLERRRGRSGYCARFLRVNRTAATCAPLGTSYSRT